MEFPYGKSKYVGSAKLIGLIEESMKAVKPFLDVALGRNDIVVRRKMKKAK